MVVKSFIQHLKSVGEFDGQEKFDKVLDQFTYTKDGKRKDKMHLYESINKSWKSWINGEFEVDGVDRAQLKKELKARGIDYSQIDNWKAAQTQKRGTEKIAEIKFLDNQNSKFPNRSLEQVEELFKKKFPNSNFYLRVNNLTELKRNGVYVSGANSERSITGIGKGDRAGWLKKAYGKQFAGNYSKIINAADQLAAAGETAKAERLYRAADKFFGPTGIVRKSAVGEAEHALARSFDFLNPDRQLAINSIIDGDLNQFKKNLFDIPVKRYFDEYNNPNTTKARRVELKNLIEERKKVMNALTGGQTKGIVAGDIVNFRYGANEITATSSVKPIDTLFKEGKFDINEYVERGNKYTEAFKTATKNIDIKKDFSKPINESNLKNLLQKLEIRGCGNAAGGRILFSEGSPDGKITKCAQKGINGFLDDLKKGNYSKATMNILKGGGNVVKNILNPMELVKLRNYLGPTALGFMAAFEAGVITDDVIRQGTPLNESLAQNWLTKSFLPYTEQYAKAKNLLESGKVPSNMKKYVKDVITFNEMLMDMKGIEGRKESRLLDVGGYGKIDGTSMYTKEQEAKDEADLMKKAKTLTENVFTPGSAKDLEMKALQDEMEATRMAKKRFKPLFGFDKLKDVRTPPDTGIQDYLPDEKPKDLRPITYMDAEYEDVKKLPDAIRKQYEDFFSSEEGKNLLKPRQSLSELQYDADNTIYDELLKDYNAFQRQKVASQLPGYYGANEKFSEGGIASLKNKKPTNTQKLAKVYKNPGFKYWAVPPKKGPLSKGLKVPPKQVKKV